MEECRKLAIVTYGNGLIKLYMNGTLQSSKQIGDLNQVNKANFTIGKQSQAQSEMKGTSFFTGSIDEIRIYNRILTQAEVDLLYADFSTDLCVFN
ncbi:MAG: LamG domain-containing protein [Bacteroidales bacterium]